MKKRLLSMSLMLCMVFIFAVGFSFAATEETILLPPPEIVQPAFFPSSNGDIPVNHDNTIDDIVEKAKIYPHTGFNANKATRYDVVPSLVAPYSPGSLNEDDKRDALNTLKMVRFLAGLPYENISFVDSLNNSAQHKAVLLTASKFDHFPVKPADMENSFYQTAQSFDAECISAGFPNISNSVIAFIADPYINNISEAGHRIALFNPAATLFGIGYAENYRVGAQYQGEFAAIHIGYQFQFSESYIAWPNAGDFPMQYFPYDTMNQPTCPWSISLGMDYRTPSKDEITLRLTRQRDGMQWTFDRNTEDLDDRKNAENLMHFAVHGEDITFRPGANSIGTIRDGDVFNVYLSGIRDIYGRPTTLSYDIRFFDLNNEINRSRITFRVVHGGNSVSDVAVTINGQTLITDANGIVSLRVNNNRNYTYTISKDGYVQKTGTVSVATSSVSEEIAFVKNQNITVADISAKIYGDSVFQPTVTPDSTSNLRNFTYSSSNPAVATVDGSGNISIVGVGQTTIAVTEPGNSDYAAVSVPKTLSVGKRQLTASASTVDREYNGNANVAVMITPDNLVGADHVVLTAAGSMSDAEAGDNKPVTISNIRMFGTMAANYIAPANIADTVINISKVVVSGVHQSMFVKSGLDNVYHFDLNKLVPDDVADGQIEAFSIVGGETGAIIDGMVSITSTTLELPILSSAIVEQAAHRVVIGFSSRNYDIADAMITIDVVEKSPVMIHASMPGRMYNGGAYAFNGGTVVTDAVNGENITGVTLTYEYSKDNITWDTTAPVNVGRYFLRIAGEEYDEYIVTPLVISFVITKAEISIVADDKTATEGDNKPTFTYIVNGQIRGENAIVSGVPNAFCIADMNVAGSYPILMDITGVNLGENYQWAAIPVQDATLTIKAKQTSPGPTGPGGGGGGGGPTGPVEPIVEKEPEVEEPEEVEKPEEPTGEDKVGRKRRILNQKPWENPFSDVATTDWFYDNIAWVHQSGIMNGVSATSFSPDEPLTRAMFAQLMYNYAGALGIRDTADEEDPANAAETNPFIDVPEDAWYYDAVVWAASQNIIRGYGDGLFGPDDDVTREQIMLLLFNYADFLKIDTNERADLSEFSDESDISEWALEAVRFMVAKNVVRGRTDTTIEPLGSATRAEVATIIKNFDEKVYTSSN